MGRFADLVEMSALAADDSASGECLLAEDLDPATLSGTARAFLRGELAPVMTCPHDGPPWVYVIHLAMRLCHACADSYGLPGPSDDPDYNQCGWCSRLWPVGSGGSLYVMAEPDALAVAWTCRECADVDQERCEIARLPFR